MADSSVVQEFLMELGFKVDRATLDAFTKALKGGAIEAVAFGNIWEKVAEQAAKAVEGIIKGVFEMTAQLDTLYFASRRIGDTAENIEAVKYALSQVGISAGDAQGAMEGLRHVLDLYGPEALKTMLPGIDIKGIENNPALILPKILERLHAELMSANLQIRQQGMNEIAGLGRLGLNINAGDVRAYDPVKEAAAQREYNETLKELGENETEAARNAEQTEHAMRSLNMQLKLMFEKYAGPLIIDLKDIVLALKDMANEFNTGLLPAIQDTLSPLGELMGLMGKPAPKEFVYSIVDDFTYMVRIVQSALGLLHALLSGDTAKTAAYGMALERWAKLWWNYDKGIKGSAADVAAANAATAAAEGVSGPDKLTGINAVNNAIAAAARGVEANERDYQAKLAAGTGPMPPAPAAGEVGSLAYRTWAANQVEQAALHYGRTPEEARGIAAGVFGEHGTPTAVNPKSGAFGIEQLLGNRLAAYRAKYGDSTDINDQIRFMFEDDQSDRGWATVHGDRATAFRNYIRNVMRPDLPGSTAGFEADYRAGLPYLIHQEAASGPAPSQTLTQNITNNVHGNMDRATADHLAMNIETVGQRLMRNFKNPGP